MMIHKKILGCLIVAIMTIASLPEAWAQKITKDDVIVAYDQHPDGTIWVKTIKNDNTKQITVTIDNASYTINAGGSANVNMTAKKRINLNIRGGGGTIWKYSPALGNESPVDPSNTETKESLAEKALDETIPSKKEEDKASAKPMAPTPQKEGKKKSQPTPDSWEKDKLEEKVLIDDEKQSAADTAPSLDESMDNGTVIYILMATIIVLIGILVFAFSRKNKAGKKDRSIRDNESQSQYVAISTTSRGGASQGGADGGIVVRRRTASILKKQDLSDVRNSPEYMKIDSAEFSGDSAVRNIYIKNQCIRDVYSMYAEDLRNTENPKEDGCMVLGRWELDPMTRTYDVSLEEVVYPGDDAVFKEYELNFGGKIKLKIAERLRRLRKDTNLQYDLVCWIHSHPGLGVFFSNSDDVVQLQLKHPQHPNFLVAFVVDILTASQETGIFTFRKDGSMNSGGDIRKKYSLEEMYQWALASERTTYNPENYMNLLGNAKLRLENCTGVEVNNSAIIDMTQIIDDESASGIAGWIIGAHIEKAGEADYVVKGISINRPGAGLIGCLVKVQHLSLPTIQKLLAPSASSLNFVIVYSIRLGTLTTIPMVDGQPVAEEQYYGDTTLDELKTWTRRRR